MRPKLFELSKEAYKLQSNGMRLLDWLYWVDDTATRDALVTIYNNYGDIWDVAQGSTGNHQAWPGGLRDHLASMCRLGWMDYQTRTEFFGPLPFSFDDVVVAIFCHDAEKLLKNAAPDDPRCVEYLNLYAICSSWEEVKTHLLTYWQHAFKLPIPAAYWNAVKFTHGEPAHLYRKDRRVMNELAAFVGNLDRDSARVHHSSQQGMG